MSRPRDLFYVVSDTFTRPADTTQYAAPASTAAGDLVANSTTAGSVTLMDWAFEEPVWLRQVKLTKSDPDIVSASFRLWLINDSAVTFSNGDNGGLSIASSTLPIANVIRPIDLTFDFTLPGSGDVAIATFDRGLVPLPTTTYGFLEARAGYTPGNAEVFVIELTCDPR